MLKNLLVQPVLAVDQVVDIADITNVGDLVTYVANALIIVGFAVVIVFLALGFLRYVTSQGEKTAVESAQNTLTYAVIGGVGLLLVFTLKTILLSVLGLDADDPTESTAK